MSYLKAQEVEFLSNVKELEGAQRIFISSLPSLQEYATSSDILNLLDKEIKQSEGQIQRLETALNLLTPTVNEESNHQIDTRLRNIFYRLSNAATTHIKEKIVLSSMMRIYNCLITAQEDAARYGDSLGYIITADTLRENAREMAGLVQEVAQTDEKRKTEHISHKRSSFQQVQ